MISSSQRPLPDNTQHSQQTDNHALVGIRTHNLSRRAAAYLRLSPRGRWDRRYSIGSWPKNILECGDFIVPRMYMCHHVEWDDPENFPLQIVRTVSETRPSFWSVGFGVLSWGYCGLGVMLTMVLLLMSRLRMNKTVPLPPPPISRRPI